MAAPIIITITVRDASEIGAAINAAVQQASQQIAKEAAAVDYSRILSAEFVTLEKIHAGYFAEQRAPSGAGWAALSPATVAKKGHTSILFEEGTLQNSLISGGAGAIRQSGGNELVYGTSVAHAGYHQTGFKNKRTGRRVPARPMVGLSGESVDKIANNVADGIVARLQ